MAATVGHQLQLLLLVWTCIFQTAYSSSVAVATSPIVTAITLTVPSTYVDSILTSYATCYGCDDTSIYCQTTGTSTVCLDAAVSAAEITSTIYQTSVATSTTVITTTIGYTTIYSDVAEGSVPGGTAAASHPSSTGSLSTLSDSAFTFGGPVSTAGATGTSKSKTSATIKPDSSSSANSGNTSSSSAGMSMVTKAALGAAIGLGAILIGVGMFFYIKRRQRNNISRSVLGGAATPEPSTFPEKYDGPNNQYFFAKPTSSTDGSELDGRSAANSSIVPPTPPQEVPYNPIHHVQGNPLYETRGNPRYETAGNVRYETAGSARHETYGNPRYEIGGNDAYELPDTSKKYSIFPS